MIEPPIQYAQTEDGVSLAYWTVGSGMPFIHVSSPPFSHIQWEWQLPGTKAWCEFMAERVMYVRYDARGLGLSDREPLDFSVESQMNDLGTIIDKLNIETCALMGAGNAGPVAIAFAASHPDRVSQLVLSTAYTRTSDWGQSPRLRSLGSLVDRDWETFTETYAHMIEGWSTGEEGSRMAEFLRASITKDGMQRLASDLRHYDVSELLHQVAVPTLILQPEDNIAVPMETARRIGSQIAGAQLVVTKGKGGHSGRDWEAFRRAIPNFLGLEGPVRRMDIEQPTGTAIILFADIANSTALTEQLGDAAFRDKARALDTALRDAITSADGTAIEGKLLGDGVLAVFGAAREAIACSSACHAASQNVGLDLHVGIHAGDVIHEDNNVFGGAVNIAARVADASSAGETLVSQTVRDLARTSAGVTFEDRGEYELKGIEEPQRLFAVKA